MFIAGFFMISAVPALIIQYHGENVIQNTFVLLGATSSFLVGWLLLIVAAGTAPTTSYACSNGEHGRCGIGYCECKCHGET